MPVKQLVLKCGWLRRIERCPDGEQFAGHALDERILFLVRCIQQLGSILDTKGHHCGKIAVNRLLHIISQEEVDPGMNGSERASCAVLNEALLKLIKFKPRIKSFG